MTKNELPTGFSVGMIGGGMVGSAAAAYYDGMKVYDKYKDSDSIEDVCKADYIFVAVPTPFGSTDNHGSNSQKSADYTGYDLTEMDDAIANVVKNLIDKEKQVVIIKSTVLAGTTDKYQEKYPDVNFIFNPEFLTESVAAADFAGPDKQIVGYTEKTKDIAQQVMEVLPDAPYKSIVPAKIAEMTKSSINTYYAFKVIFANQLYDLCQATGVDYDQVREGLTHDKRIIDSHFDIFHGGFRGFGGKCLPKDVSALSWFSEKNGAELKLVKKIIELNKKLSEQNETSP